jgi:hypothetical protein
MSHIHGRLIRRCNALHDSEPRMTVLPKEIINLTDPSLPAPLVLLSGISRGNIYTQTARWSHNPPFIFWNKEGRLESRDSSVSIVTGYGLDDRGVGVRVPVALRIFSSPRRPDRFSGPSSVLTYRNRGVKRPARETDHPPPTSAEVKKMWIYISTPSLRLHGVVLN